MILEQVAISFSRGSSQPMDRTGISCFSFTGRQILYLLVSSKIILMSLYFPSPVHSTWHAVIFLICRTNNTPFCCHLCLSSSADGFWLFWELSYGVPIRLFICLSSLTLTTVPPSQVPMFLAPTILKSFHFLCMLRPLLLLVVPSF